MLLGINNIPACGFGNKLLYYYNLRKESIKRDCEFFCIPWSGYQLFEGNMLGVKPTAGKHEILNFCLGERFYSQPFVSTKEIFKLKEIPPVPPFTCAIHFRGGDFHHWNPASILKTQYYLDSIDEIKSRVSNFILFTDDINLKSYLQIQEYLMHQKLDFTKGINTSNRNLFAQDFVHMTECDYIVSSPSTYAICAGFVGKQKKIIHSKEWVEYRVAEEDKFWCDLYDGGNEDYKLWRII